jgi:hypothetical protein
MAKSKRRHFQFSVRTLLVGVLLMSVPLSWLATKRWRERRAVAEIRRAGGTVLYEYHPPHTWRGSRFVRTVFGDDFFAQEYQVGFYPQKANDRALRHLRDLPEVKVLCVESGDVTEAGLEHLEGLTELVYLWLDEAKVADAGLEHLKGLTSLADLHLPRSLVTGSGVRHVKGLPDLRGLDLAGAPVTDAGLRHVEELAGLHCLVLSDTQISDAGLGHLCRMTGLQLVDVAGTRVTAEGVRKLRKALPYCNVISDWPETGNESASP